VTEAVNTHSGAPESCLPPVYAKVALDTPLDRLFDYLALDATSGDIGRRVEAPFGNRILVGVLLALSNKTEVALENLKPLHAIDRFSPPLPPDLLDLACCTASPAAARPRSICNWWRMSWRVGGRCWCWCRKSTSRPSSWNASSGVFPATN
jgi:hypothetical protein